MTTGTESRTPRYTCREYREEMILAELQRALQTPGLSPMERERIEKEIARQEKAMGL